MADIVDILIVDDEVEICEVLSEVLVGAGYKTAMAHSGADAIAASKANPPYLILCDISMPNMSGLEALEGIRKLGIPSAVVMLTAHSEKERIIQALQLGAMDYVTKPFDPQVVIDRAAEWVEMGKRFHSIQSAGRDGNADAVTEKLRMVELFRLKNAQKAKTSA